MNWQEISGNWVYTPPHSIGIVHFLGGAFVATAPQITYRFLLEHLGQQGYTVIATPFVNTLDHRAIAQEVLERFEQCLTVLRATVIRKQYLPIYGLGHSMGSKLHLLIGSLFPVERAGNILISFNNFPARRSIPLIEQVNVDVEFTPSPRETTRLVAAHYCVRRNLLIRFRKDEIDQTRSITQVLQQRFPDMVTVKILSGNHLTPLGQEVNWRAGKEYSPLDALGQWVKQELYRDLNQLKQEMSRWLNPLTSD